MSTARLIAAVTLFIIARGQARPLDLPPDLQNGSYTNVITNDAVSSAEPKLEEPAGTNAEVVADNLKPETSNASVDNEQTLPSEAFTGGKSESTVTSNTPITQEKQLFLNRNTSENVIPSNDSVSIRAPEEMPTEKIGDKSKSAGSDNEDVFSLQHLPSTVIPSPFPGQNIASSSHSAEQPFNYSISTKSQTTEHHALSTLLIQNTSADTRDEDSKIQPSVSVDSEIHRNDVAKSVNDAATKQPTPAALRPTQNTTGASTTTPATPLTLHDGNTSHTKKLSTTEKQNPIQLSNIAGISERLGHHSPNEESSSKDIEIEAEGAEASSSKGQAASSSNWLFTAVTVAVAMDGIVKAFSSSSPSFKDAASSTMPLSTPPLSEGKLSASSFVDPSISKSASSPAASLPPVSPSTAELPDPSFVVNRILKSQSISSTKAPTEMPVSSSVDTKITKNSNLSTTSLALPLSQVTSNVSDSSFVDTKAAKDSLPSTGSQVLTNLPDSTVADIKTLTNPSLPTSSSDSSQKLIEEFESSLVDKKISKDSSSVTSSSASFRKSAEEPGPPFVASSVFKDTSSLSSVSISTLTQAPELPRISMPLTALSSSPASAQLTASSIEDINISNDVTSIMPSPASNVPQMSAELPASSITDTRILKDPSSLSLTAMPLSPPSAELPNYSLGNILAIKTISSQPLKEVPVSSLVEAKILKDSPSSPTLSLTQKSEDLRDARISKDSPSPLPLSPPAASQVPAKIPLPSFANEPNSNAAEYVPLNSFENAPLITTSFEKLSATSEEKRDDADLLNLTDIGDDMDVAETMVFRPVFSYRQDSARRRLFRSAADQL